MKEFQLIKDIQYEYNADIGLSYSSPCRGEWNIVHIAALVPEAHQIFVCPTSCLRGVVLTTFEMGAGDKLSTIAVGEDNILEGDMEEQLHKGCRRIIDSLPVRPRMVIVFTSCVHHFMAVNYQRIYKLLRKEYPDILFTDAYMDPIMRRKTPPIPSLFRQLTRVYQMTEKNPRQVSYVGSCFAHHEHSDLAVVMERNGIDMRQTPAETDFDGYMKQQESCVNFLTRKAGMAAVKDMEIRLKTPYHFLRPSYIYSEIDEDMAKACEMVNIPSPCAEEKAEMQAKCEAAVNALSAKLNGTAVSLDYTCVDQPLGLAVYLLEHGINVESVFIDVFLEERSVFEKLQAMKPDLKIYSSLNWNMRRTERGSDHKVVAVGQKAAYFNDTKYFVDLVDNAGMYGYRGIMKLMSLISEASETEKDMKRLVSHKGWGCKGL